MFTALSKLRAGAEGVVCAACAESWLMVLSTNEDADVGLPSGVGTGEVVVGSRVGLPAESVLRSGLAMVRRIQKATRRLPRVKRGCLEKKAEKNRRLDEKRAGSARSNPRDNFRRSAMPNFMIKGGFGSEIPDGQCGAYPTAVRQVVAPRVHSRLFVSLSSREGSKASECGALPSRADILGSLLLL